MPILQGAAQASSKGAVDTSAFDAALFQLQTGMRQPLDQHPQQLSSGAVADGVAARKRSRPTHLSGGDFVRDTNVYSQQKIFEATVTGDSEVLKR